jgi:large subunit ribosomal protein L4
MKYPIYNEKGDKDKEEITLPEEVFGIKASPDLVHQVFVSQMANKRQSTAHTKGKGEVSGGGKKPWQQKGTGRARVGSNRSPIWIGGGVTFGPTNQRNFKKIVPKKMKRKALLMMLSSKVEEKLLIVLDNFKIEKPRTKEILNILKKLPCEAKNCLIALSEPDKNLFLASRNIPKVKVIEARNLSCIDLLSYKYLVIQKDAVKKIKETFKK